MNLSIASYSFHGLLEEGKMDVFGYLESLKYRYGVHAADLWSGMLASLDEAYLKKVREAMEEKDMILVNLAVDFADAWHSEPDIRERYYKNALAHLRAAEILGAKSVRIDLGSREFVMDDTQFEVVVKRFKEYAEIGNDRGFKVGTENHFGPARVPENIINVANAVNHPNFGLLLHFGSWAVDAENGDKQVAKLVMHTHVDKETTESRLDECIQIMKDIDYKGHWGVEHHSGRHEYAEVAWQLATVRRGLTYADFR